MQAVKLHPVNDLTSRKENSPQVEEDKMVLSALSELSTLSQETWNLETGLRNLKVLSSEMDQAESRLIR